MYFINIHESEIVRISRELWGKVFKERIEGLHGLSDASQDREKYEMLFALYWMEHCGLN